MDLFATLFYQNISIFYFNIVSILQYNSILLFSSIMNIIIHL